MSSSETLLTIFNCSMFARPNNSWPWLTRLPVCTGAELLLAEFCEPLAPVGGGDDDTGKRRDHVLAVQQRLECLVLDRGIGQFHIGDLPVFALALIQRLLQVAFGGAQVHTLALQLLLQILQFIAGDDAALRCWRFPVCRCGG